jgi:glycerol kinase
MLQNTGEKAVTSRNRLLTTVAWRLGKRTDYALEGSIFAGGSVVQWLRDRLGLIRSSEDIEALAGSVSETGGVYLVPAFAGLGAPHWDPYARGLLIGLTQDTTAAQIARAALDGIAYQVADLFDAMHADAGLQLDELKVDGGMSMSNLLMQFQADLLGIPVIRPTMIETTALGAAYLAGLAVGYWRNVQELSTQWLVERRFEPRMRRGHVESRRERWRAALERAKGWEGRGEGARAQ